MIEIRRDISIGWFEFASVLLIVGVVAVMRQWPSAEKRTRGLRQARCTVSYVRLSHSKADMYAYFPIALPDPLSGFGRMMRCEGSSAGENKEREYGDMSVLFIRSMRSDEYPALPEDRALKARVAAASGSLTFPRTAKSVYATEPVTTNDALRVEVAGELKDRGFVPDSSIVSEMKTADTKPWSVTAYVETDRSGRTTHVFLLTPSLNPRVNRCVMSALYGGTLSGKEGPASGRVSLGYNGTRGE